jgi:Peptidase family M1 domain
VSARFLWWLLLLPLVRLWGQPATSHTAYDAQAAFAPNFFPSAPNGFRGPDGAPGPAYWQNEANYRVAATLDTVARRLSGEVIIDYINRSPQNLPFLWLELDQNIDREDSRANRMNRPGTGTSGPNGFHFQVVECSAHGKWLAAPYVVCGTRMQIRLAQPLRAQGGRIRLRLKYDYRLLPWGNTGRSGILSTANGPVFQVSYWYPRMCVFDDVRGWNVLPFLGAGEFYMDYGDIDYRVTLPRGLLVAGAGVLLNPRQVLSPAQLRRLERARNSDQAVFIRPPDEVRAAAPDPAPQAQVTWHFQMNHTRDVAWAASRAFVWDAARIRLPGGRQALAMSFYPPESGTTDSWGRATEYLKHSVELFSRDWFVYPYPVAINVAGRVGGMEFPGLTFDGWKAKNKFLWSLLAHEIGHTWFPMVVGSDERRNAWMDEGFNTFIDIYASQEFNHGEYAPKRDGEYAPKGGNPADEIVRVLTNLDLPPIMSLAESFRTGLDRHSVEYFKTAFGLVLLREVILGHERFDYAFRRYIADWAFKHPSSWDFFRAMDNGAGEDLSWFWRGWFEHNWQLDQAVKDVSYVSGDPGRGARITIANLRQLPMPVLAEITDAEGHRQRLRLPVEIWQSGATQTFQVNTTTRLTSVVLDADHLLPDIDRSNNVWPPPP